MISIAPSFCRLGTGTSGVRSVVQLLFNSCLTWHNIPYLTVPYRLRYCMLRCPTSDIVNLVLPYLTFLGLTLWYSVHGNLVVPFARSVITQSRSFSMFCVTTWNKFPPDLRHFPNGACCQCLQLLETYFLLGQGWEHLWVGILKRHYINFDWLITLRQQLEDQASMYQYFSASPTISNRHDSVLGESLIYMDHKKLVLTCWVTISCKLNFNPKLRFDVYELKFYGAYIVNLSLDFEHSICNHFRSVYVF